MGYNKDLFHKTVTNEVEHKHFQVRHEAPNSGLSLTVA